MRNKAIDLLRGQRSAKLPSDPVYVVPYYLPQLLRTLLQYYVLDLAIVSFPAQSSSSNSGKRSYQNVDIKQLTLQLGNLLANIREHTNAV